MRSSRDTVADMMATGMIPGMFRWGTKSTQFRLYAKDLRKYNELHKVGFKGPFADLRDMGRRITKGAPRELPEPAELVKYEARMRRLVNAGRSPERRRIS